MRTELQERILRAVTMCTERLHRRPYRQQAEPILNKKEIESHGPQVIEAQFHQCLEHLTDRSIQRTPSPKDLEACRNLLSRFIEIQTVKFVPTNVPLALPSFPDMLEQRLRPAVHTGKSLGLTALGMFLQLPRVTRIGAVEAWSHFGFFLFLDTLLAAYPEPSPYRFEKILTNARLLAYSLSALEHASTLDELVPLKHSLTALTAGVVPVAYTPDTKTLCVGNWYW